MMPAMYGEMASHAGRDVERRGRLARIKPDWMAVCRPVRLCFQATEGDVALLFNSPLVAQGCHDVLVVPRAFAKECLLADAL